MASCVTHLCCIFYWKIFPGILHHIYPFISMTLIFFYQPNQVRKEHKLYEVGDFVQHQLLITRSTMAGTMAGSIFFLNRHLKSYWTFLCHSLVLQIFIELSRLCWCSRPCWCFAPLLMFFTNNWRSQGCIFYYPVFFVTPYPGSSKLLPLNCRLCYTKECR